MLGRLARDKNLGVWHLVPPGDFQDAAEALQLECVQSPLLPGICSPCLAAVKLCADDVCVVVCHLSLHCQLEVSPHSGSDASEGCGCLSDPLVNLSVERVVVCDG